MDEARTDGADDDEGGNSEDDHGEYEDGSGSVGDGTDSQSKRRQARSVETELNVYTRVHQVSLDTDPLMWWKQHVQEFPHLSRMDRQHLTVPVTSASPERLFISVGLVKSDLWGSLLDTTLIDVMWAKQAP